MDPSASLVLVYGNHAVVGQARAFALISGFLGLGHPAQAVLSGCSRGWYEASRQAAHVLARVFSVELGEYSAAELEAFRRVNFPDAEDEPW